MINRSNGLPVYIQIMNWITSNIENRTWEPHYKMPSEDDLAKMLGVSRGTIRQALSELANQGVLYRMHGKGTFVAPTEIEHNLTGGKFLTFIEELHARGVHVTTEVLDCSIINPSLHVAAYLNLSPADKVMHLKRLRKVDSTPIMLLENYVVYDLFSDIEKVDFTVRPLYDVIENSYGMKINWARRVFEAKPAEAEIAELLKVSEGTPLMCVDQIVYDYKGRCLDCAVFWGRSDKTKISVTMSR